MNYPQYTGNLEKIKNGIVLVNAYTVRLMWISFVDKLIVRSFLAQSLKGYTFAYRSWEESQGAGGGTCVCPLNAPSKTPKETSFPSRVARCTAFSFFGQHSLANHGLALDSGASFVRTQPPNSIRELVPSVTDKFYHYLLLMAHSL